MKYKAIICDVDGTLVPNKIDGRPSQKVKDAIARAKDKIHVGIATARSYSQAKSIIDELELSAPCIITGGSQIYNPVSKTFYSEKLLLPEQIQKVRELAQKMRIGLIIADAQGEQVLTKKYTPIKPFDLYTEALPKKKADKFMHTLSEYDGIALHKTLSWEGDNLFHITAAHPEASKQHGILEVAKILQISTHEIIGIGEGYNDFPLLLACGLKVAMGNAVDDVKAIADYIAPTVEKDGVADVIEKFVL